MICSESFRNHAPANLQAPSSRPDGTHKFSGDFTALVVDDNPGMLKFASAMLSRLGFAVRTAGEGVEALFELCQSPSRLVLTDYEMPAINGYQLGRRIKAQLPDTRVVIMTGRERTAVAELMRDKNIDGWLFKPFGADELERLLLRMGLPVCGGSSRQR